MVRIIAGAVVGVVVAGLCVFGIQFLGHLVYPPPAGLDMGDAAGVAAYVAGAPLGALLFVIAAWSIGTLIGTAVAMLIGGWNIIAGALAGAVNTGFAVATVIMVPHPAWMVASGLGLTALAAVTAIALCRRA